MKRYDGLKFYTRRNYADELVLIDGISRSGKFMLSHVAAAFKGIEFIQYPFLLENLPYLVRFGKLDFETCRIILQTDVDYAAYNMMIGRSLNTRRADITSVHNSVDPERLLSRAAREDESALVEEFLKNKRLPLFFCHEGMCNMRTILGIFPKAKVIHILRDPAALVMSWHKKGYGKRWGNDPKVIPFAFDTPYGTVPWFAVDIAKDYARADEMERIVLSIGRIMAMAREEFEALAPEQKKQILLVSFERFTADPEPDLKRIEAFTRKTRHPGMQAILDRERLPRPHSEARNDALAEEAKAPLSAAGRGLLDACRRDYKDYWLGLAS
ncbi:MAG: sulfotransferase [Elusimicrobia bacterium]|nr:sulfotransferase [Elusimicrobiota bacterium]